ncbi:MAG: M55 family metallopeptidase [Vulcanimicrobiaceae bacterium]
MKLYISADMEGTAAVASWTQVDPKNATEYPYYRKLMSLEVRAAIDGAREAGATGVLVNDSHSAMRNVLWDDLPADARMIYGNRKPFSMSEGIDASYGAAFFTGYHAGVGEAGGTLAHTYAPDTLYNVRVNGIACSETLLNAALLGTYGVPVALVTGDRVTCDGVRAHLPWATTVVTKDAIGYFAVDSLSPQEARERIRAGARNAIANAAAAKPYAFASPIELELDFVRVEQADFAELIPGVDRTGGRTVRYVHEDYRVVFRTFMAAMRLGAAANAPV